MRVSWRLLEPRDMARVTELHEQQQQAIGFRWEMNDPFARPMMLSLVHEDEAGVIDQVMMVEASAEVCLVGVKTLAPKEYGWIGEQVAMDLRLRGIKLARCFVPSGLVECEAGAKKEPPMARLLKAIGFTKETTLQNFWRKI